MRMQIRNNCTIMKLIHSFPLCFTLANATNQRSTFSLIKQKILTQTKSHNALFSGRNKENQLIISLLKGLEIFCINLRRQFQRKLALYFFFKFSYMRHFFFSFKTHHKNFLITIHYKNHSNWKIMGKQIILKDSPRKIYRLQFP